MPSKNPAQRLRDIIDNVDAINAFAGELDLEAFRADRKTVYAVVRALEIIPEASRRLPGDLLHRHPENCAAIAASGNFDRHECEGVDEALIWHTAPHGLADLRRVSDEEFRRLQSDQSPTRQTGGLLS